MKAFLALLLSCLFIGHSEKQQSKGYEIIGNVKNLPAKWVFMRIGKRDLKDNHPYWPKIDSARVIDGKFTLSKDSDIVDPAWASSIAYIDTNTKKAISLKFLNPINSKIHSNFILENAKISITGDASRGLTITGSKETDFNFKYGLIFPTYRYELNPKNRFT